MLAAPQPAGAEAGCPRRAEPQSGGVANPSRRMVPAAPAQVNAMPSSSTGDEGIPAVGPARRHPPPLPLPCFLASLPPMPVPASA